METNELVLNSLVYALESGINLIVFYIFYYALLRKETSFQFTRYYLLLAPLTAVILPLISLPMGLFFESATTKLDYSLSLTQVEISSVISKNFSFSGVVFWVFLIVYAVGLIISLHRFIRQLYTLWNLKNRNNMDNWNGYAVVSTNGEYPTFSFLKTIFYDSDSPLPQAEKLIVLLHESIHIKEYHSIDILITKFLKTIFWYNPLFEMFLDAIKLNHEYMADSKVLSTSGISKSAYQKSLAVNTLRSPYLNIGTFYNRSQTLNRIKMMDQSPKSITLIKILTLLLITTCLIFTFSCEKNEDTLDSMGWEPAADDKDIANTESDTSEEIFTVVDEQPSFQGKGNAEFLEYVGKNLQYSEEFVKNKLEGKVYVQFVIEKDGSVNDVQVIKGIGAGADQEAVKVIKNSPRWSPGKQRGEPIRVRMILPISFELQ